MNPLSSSSITQHHLAHFSHMTAIFNFESLLLVILLIICTCTYARATAPGLVDRNKNGDEGGLGGEVEAMDPFSGARGMQSFLGIFFKFARIGERLSPYVALACIVMGFRILLN